MKKILELRLVICFLLLINIASIGYGLPTGNYSDTTSDAGGNAAMDMQSITTSSDSVTVILGGNTIGDNSHYYNLYIDYDSSHSTYARKISKKGSGNTNVAWDLSGESGMSPCWIRIDSNFQNDANSGVDAGDDFSSALSTSIGAVETGMLVEDLDHDDYYKFSAILSSFVTVVITANPSSDYDLYLYNPSGAEVDYSNTTSNEETVTAMMDQSGDWRFHVKRYEGTGDYDFSIVASRKRVVSDNSWSSRELYGSDKSPSSENVDEWPDDVTGQDQWQQVTDLFLPELPKMLLDVPFMTMLLISLILSAIFLVTHRK